MYGEKGAVAVAEELCLEQWEILAFILPSLAKKHLAVCVLVYVLNILLYLHIVKTRTNGDNVRAALKNTKQKKTAVRKNSCS